MVALPPERALVGLTFGTGRNRKRVNLGGKGRGWFSDVDLLAHGALRLNSHSSCQQFCSGAGDDFVPFGSIGASDRCKSNHYFRKGCEEREREKAFLKKGSVKVGTTSDIPVYW